MNLTVISIINCKLKLINIKCLKGITSQNIPQIILATAFAKELELAINT